MKSVIEGGILFAGALLIATSAWAQAASSKPVDVKNDWSVFKADNPTVCWGASSPQKSVATRGGKEVKVSRGPIELFVSFSAGAHSVPEISFNVGYPFAKNSTAEMDVDGKKYELFTQADQSRDTAWPRIPAVKSGLITALKNGSALTITGHSDRGTQTKDTFSLKGFTAAMDEAEKICKK